MKKAIAIVSTLALIVITGGIALGQSGERPPHRPPQEAFDACDGAEEGDECSFDGHHGSIEGTCQTPNDDELHCVPDHRPPPPPRQ